MLSSLIISASSCKVMHIPNPYSTFSNCCWHWIVLRPRFSREIQRFYCWNNTKGVKTLLQIEFAIHSSLSFRFPSPQVPRVDLFKDVIVDSLIVAAIAYCISLSMAKLFASKYKYKINGTQEMFAQVFYTKD